MITHLSSWPVPTWIENYAVIIRWKIRKSTSVGWPWVDKYCPKSVNFITVLKNCVIILVISPSILLNNPVKSIIFLKIYLMASLMKLWNYEGVYESDDGSLSKIRQIKAQVQVTQWMPQGYKDYPVRGSKRTGIVRVTLDKATRDRQRSPYLTWTSR